MEVVPCPSYWHSRRFATDDIFALLDAPVWGYVDKSRKSQERNVNKADTGKERIEEETWEKSEAVAARSEYAEVYLFLLDVFPGAKGCFLTDWAKGRESYLTQHKRENNE